MDIKIANPLNPEPCETCGTVTTRQYQLDPRDASIDEYRVCEACIDDEINAYNDALYGKQEWYNDGYRELSDSELLQLIDTEFVRTGTGIRWDSRTLREHDHLDKAEYMEENDHLDTGVAGVDEARSFRPTAERRLELIKTYNLFKEWDLTMQRQDRIKTEICTGLGKDRTDVDFSVNS